MQNFYICSNTHLFANIYYRTSKPQDSLNLFTPHNLTSAVKSLFTYISFSWMHHQYILKTQNTIDYFICEG